jgi:hypothetical protein
MLANTIDEAVTATMGEGQRQAVRGRGTAALLMFEMKVRSSYFWRILCHL